MTVKMTGLEWKAYVVDDSSWPDGGYVEDEEVSINGCVIEYNSFDTDDINDGDVVTLSGGQIIIPDSEKEMTMESHFKKWRKAQPVTYLTISVPHEKLEVVKAAIVSAGGKL